MNKSNSAFHIIFIFFRMIMRGIFGLLYVYEYFYFVVGNYLIDPYELMVHHVRIQ